jgi:chromosomal replication initiator protein
MNKDIDIERAIREKWQEIKETVRTECMLTQISYNTWVEPLSFLELKKALR